MKTTRVPLYGFKLHLSIDMTEASAFIKAHSALEENDLADISGVSHTFLDAKGTRFWILGIFDGLINTAAHEALHTAWAILDTCHAKVSPSNHEPMAYLIGWLVDEILFLYPDLQPTPPDKREGAQSQAA